MSLRNPSAKEGSMPHLKHRQGEQRVLVSLSDYESNEQKIGLTNKDKVGLIFSFFDEDNNIHLTKKINE